MPDPKPEFDLAEIVAESNKKYFTLRRIEAAIMSTPTFDYSEAWQIFQALQARLERVYEDNLDEKVASAMKAMDRALAGAEEIEPDPNWDRDQIADDPRSAT